VLSIDVSDNASWTWSGSTPDHWDIDQSPDGVSSWVFFDQVPGATLTYPSLDPAAYYRVSGRDSGDVQITGYSNVVLAP